MKRIVVLLVTILWVLPVAAHKSSDSYLRLQAAGTELSGRWDIAIRDLHELLGLDSNGNGEITWGELQQQQQAVTEAALAGLTVKADERTCELMITRMQITEHVDGPYAALMLAGECPLTAQTMTIDYSFLFALDPTHRGLLKLSFGGVQSTILSPSRPAFSAERAHAGSGAAFIRYLREGAWHIWAGLDHMLFLICLLLPAVLRRVPGGWMAVDSGRQAFWDVLKIVTAFTVAHALSLTAASLEWLRLPTRWVEAAVAATIIFAALNNLYPLVRVRRMWAVAFGFGLIHGIGYASVLGGLGLPAGVLAMSLLGFNIGVESGQILVTAMVMPLAFALRKRHWYRHAVVVPGSVLVALLAAVWMLQRLFNIRLEGLW